MQIRRTAQRYAVPVLTGLAILAGLVGTAHASSTATLSITQLNAPAGRTGITISFNGFSETVLTDTTSSPGSIASAFAASFSRDYIRAGLCASAVGNVVTFKLKTGTFAALVIDSTPGSFALTSTGFNSPAATAIALPRTRNRDLSIASVTHPK